MPSINEMEQKIIKRTVRKLLKCLKENDDLDRTFFEFSLESKESPSKVFLNLFALTVNKVVVERVEINTIEIELDEHYNLKWFLELIENSFLKEQ
jgi:hypothetical protein